MCLMGMSYQQCVVWLHLETADRHLPSEAISSQSRASPMLNGCFKQAHVTFGFALESVFGEHDQWRYLHKYSSSKNHRRDLAVRPQY